MNDSFDITTIVLALLALFVVWKLRSVLGTRTGQEQGRRDPASPAPTRPDSGGDDKVVRLPGGAGARRPPPQPAPAAARPRPETRWDGLADKGSKVWEGLDQIAAAEPAFNGQEFLAGAKSAYEMIITAFATGDRQTLRNLLAKDVFESFANAITEREANGQRVDTTFVSIEKTRIEDARMVGRVAQIAVAFTSKLITATYGRDGKVLEGDPEKVVDVTDVWTFARDAGARDPNWKLIAT